MRVCDAMGVRALGVRALGVRVVRAAVPDRFFQWVEDSVGKGPVSRPVFPVSGGFGREGAA